MTVLPRAQAPGLKVDMLDGGTFDLAKARPKLFTLVIFYRGLHCGFCRRYLQDLKTRLGDFAGIGVDVVAISCDGKERALQSRKDWALDGVPIGYGLTLEKAAEWDLYISTGISEDQPAFFAEPGLFLIQPDGAVYAAYIQNLPWARPRLEDILFLIDFATKRNKPARGEVVLGVSTGKAKRLA